MKKYIKINPLSLTAVLLFVVFFVGVSSCKKNENPTGSIWIHLHTNIDTNEVDGAVLYRDAAGRHFGLTTAQFYISNFMIQNVDGKMYTIKNAHILKNIDSETYLVGTAPVGTYNSVSFDVGLDDATNALQPTAFSTTGYIPNTGMWYGNSTQGYMNMKIQGFADVSAAQDSSEIVHFSYEIGSSANRKNVITPNRGNGSYSSYPVYILTSGGTTYVHLICDYSKLLTAVNFKTDTTTDTYTTNGHLAATIADYIPNMFRYEE